mgnify:CR=1 FL=1|jgi:hypothetical protein
MPFALKNPYANAKVGEKRGKEIEDGSTPKKAKKAPAASSLVPPMAFLFLRVPF